MSNDSDVLLAEMATIMASGESLPPDKAGRLLELHELLKGCNTMEIAAGLCKHLSKHQTKHAVMGMVAMVSNLILRAEPAQGSAMMQSLVSSLCHGYPDGAAREWAEDTIARIDEFMSVELGCYVAFARGVEKSLPPHLKLYILAHANAPGATHEDKTIKMMHRHALCYTVAWTVKLHYDNFLGVPHVEQD